MKVNAGKSKVMVLNGEEGLECKVYVDRIRLEHVSEFNYFGCALDEAGTDGTEGSRKVTNGRRVAGAIKSLVNIRDLQLESCMKRCSYLFIRMAMRQFYAMRRRDIGLRLYRC